MFGITKKVIVNTNTPTPVAMVGDHSQPQSTRQVVVKLVGELRAAQVRLSPKNFIFDLAQTIIRLANAADGDFLIDAVWGEVYHLGRRPKGVTVWRKQATEPIAKSIQIKDIKGNLNSILDAINLVYRSGMEPLGVKKTGRMITGIGSMTPAEHKSWVANQTIRRGWLDDSENMKNDSIALLPENHELRRVLVF